jgi:hypothetical protein
VIAAEVIAVFLVTPVWSVNENALGVVSAAVVVDAPPPPPHAVRMREDITTHHPNGQRLKSVDRVVLITNSPSLLSLALIRVHLDWFTVQNG